MSPARCAGAPRKILALPQTDGQETQFIKRGGCWLSVIGPMIPVTPSKRSVRARSLQEISRKSYHLTNDLRLAAVAETSWLHSRKVMWNYV